ncbi:hypothetical protein XENOCAPTIV_004372 [Xenoophorus captivus]|uniref:Uncharacterized protein n=1 Tax=Xenoophorus captivus TaxID=1517983 RepID=A0ABV0RP03_9TELE
MSKQYPRRFEEGRVTPPLTRSRRVTNKTEKQPRGTAFWTEQDIHSNKASNFESTAAVMAQGHLYLNFPLRLILNSVLLVTETLCPHPSEQYGTRACFGLSSNIDTSTWSAAVTSPPGEMLALSICSSPKAPIGRYTLNLGQSGSIEFILLFNPWCPGVLLGKWSDGYEGGVSPLFWRGSVEILQNWDTQACQPVRYGQCWVFAAVACSGNIGWAKSSDGELTFKYDAPFVFAEVNADVVTFMKKKDGSTSKVTSSGLVGQKISTKSVGNDTREDITHLYKYPEGSDEEREAFKKANHQNKLLQEKPDPGLHITIKVTSDLRKGCDFDVFAVVTNNTEAERKCRLVFGSCAVSYNGFLGGNCGFKDLLNVQLSPGAVWGPSHRGQPNSPGSSTDGLLHRRSTTGNEKHCTGQP